jgi:hypothetical protein
MLEILLKRFRATKKLYSDVYGEIVQINRQVGNTIDVGKLADIAIVCRETAKLLADLDKEYRKTQELCERLGCMLWVSMSDEGNAETVRGKLCTATPDLKMTATLPSQKQEPEKYAQFMDSLGVPKELYERGVVQTYWPRLVDYITNLAENGKPLPPGVDVEKTRPQYRFILRLKKGVDLTEEDVLESQTVKA